MDALHLDIAGQIESFVNSEDLLVSSLFCLFEDAQIADTFRLLDADNNPVDDKTVVAWLAGVNQHFAKLNGSPPDKNPFILGYGVAQHPKVTFRRRNSPRRAFNYQHPLTAFQR